MHEKKYDIGIFTRNLKELEKRSGLKRGDFEAKIGKKAYFWQLENGRVKAPAVETLLTISEQFQVSMDYLLTGTHPEPQEPRIIAFDTEDPAVREEFLQEERTDHFVPIRILQDAAAMGPGRSLESAMTSGYAMIHNAALPRAARTQKRSNEQIVCIWAIGVFITMQKPTAEMRTEAATAGFYESATWSRKYPKVQLLTVAELLAGKKVEMPPIRQVGATFKKAPKMRAKTAETMELPFTGKPG